MNPYYKFSFDALNETENKIIAQQCGWQILLPFRRFMCFHLNLLNAFTNLLILLMPYTKHINTKLHMKPHISNSIAYGPYDATAHDRNY